jgi:hypothetical protein
MPDLPPEIIVTDLPNGGARYVLPRRPLGKWHLLGCAPLAFGLAVAGFAAAWTAGAAGGILFGGARGFGGFIVVPFVLVGGFFIAGGLRIVGLGLLILAGHSEVEVRRGRLWAVERAGPVRRLRWRAVERVRQLKITQNTRPADDDGRARPPAEPPAALADLGLILAECDRGKPLWVAPGYPRDWLRPLADELARHCQAATATGEPAPAVAEDVVRAVEAGVPQFDRPEQPAGSRAVLEEAADGGVTITLPPAGLWRGSKGLFAFALCWNGFIALFTAVIVGIFVFGKPVRGADFGALAIFGFVIVTFWAVGAGLMLGALQLGRRRAAVAVVADRLLALQSGPLGTKRREWRREELDRVAVGPSGMTVNHSPILELQVHAHDGTQLGLLAGRDADELYWIATRLRRALRLGG